MDRVKPYLLMLCVHLLATPYLHAQWQLVGSADQLPGMIYDAQLGPDGTLHVAFNRLNEDYSPHRAMIVSYNLEGTALDSVQLAPTDSVLFIGQLYQREEPGSFFVVGVRSDSTNAFFPWITVCVLDVVGSNVLTFGVEGVAEYTDPGMGFVDTDGSLVIGYTNRTGSPSAPHYYRAARYCPGQGICAAALLYLGGYGRLSAMTTIDTDRLFAIVPWSECESVNVLLELDYELNVAGCTPMNALDTDLLQEPSHFTDFIGMRQLASGNTLTWGKYEHWTPDGIEYLVGLQRSSPLGATIDQKVFSGPYTDAELVQPAVNRGLDLFDESTFAFAYNDNAIIRAIPLGVERNNVRVLRMDTALNILGEYIFDGLALDRYYFLSSIVASPDGAVYVMGNVWDYNDPTPKPKPWLARVAPEQFVSVPELSLATVNVAPNPGIEGFRITTEQASGPTHLEVRDLHGRLVHDQSLRSSNEWVHAADLPAGLYVLRMLATDGSSWAGRWVKL